MENTQNTNKKTFYLIALCWLVYACSYIGKLSYNANITQFISTYQVSKADAGMISSFFFFAFATNAFTRIDYLGCALLILTAAITAAIRLVTILTPEQTEQSPVEDSSDPNSNSDSPDEPTDTNGKDPT